MNTVSILMAAQYNQLALAKIDERYMFGRFNETVCNGSVVANTFSSTQFTAVIEDDESAADAFQKNTREGLGEVFVALTGSDYLRILPRSEWSDL